MHIHDEQFVIQAIVTTWLGPTDNLDARVRARADAGSITVGWDYALNPSDNHRAAADALMRKLEWDWPLVQGSMPGAHSGYCFVQLRPCDGEAAA